MGECASSLWIISPLLTNFPIQRFSVVSFSPFVRYVKCIENTTLVSDLAFSCPMIKVEEL